MHVEGLVLAGGASRRMGENKLELPVYPGSAETVLSRVIDTVEQVVSRVSVLVPPGSVPAYNTKSNGLLGSTASGNAGNSASPGGAVGDGTLTGWDGALDSTDTVDAKGSVNSTSHINIVHDAAAFRGPLEALAAAWPDDRETELIVVAAGDLPGLPTTVLEACIERYRFLASGTGTGGTDSGAAKTGTGGTGSGKLCDSRVDGVLIARHGVMQPLLGVYSVAAGQRLKAAVANGDQRLMRAVSGLQLDFIDSAAGRWPDWWTRPVHTPEDYQDWLRYQSNHGQRQE